eukprot:gnl/MRDRNA2_/MRDRNA2_294952_c0_seq1.p1 gnl/MRDRNA2_/MRDRNA2_294952_c0~~gnl/MRDRNA2_/MRDRNA2_294952_c0_seq1.p1  ORF type:complete len:106 (-),score=9.20 gnl/MRDRNA2_/MRDRNA2_294952_c0_seq1:300-575(-)
MANGNSIMICEGGNVKVKNSVSKHCSNKAPKDATKACKRMGKGMLCCLLVLENLCADNGRMQFKDISKARLSAFASVLVQCFLIWLGIAIH